MSNVFNRKSMPLMVLFLLFGLTLGSSLVTSGGVQVLLGHWSHDVVHDWLIPRNTSLDVNLDNNSLLYADLSGYAGDNMVWDAADMEFDASGGGSGFWNRVGTVLYPSTNDDSVQVNKTVYVDAGHCFPANFLDLNPSDGDTGLGWYIPASDDVVLRDSGNNNIVHLGSDVSSFNEPVGIDYGHYLYFRNTNQKINSSDSDTLDIHALNNMNFFSNYHNFSGEIFAPSGLMVGDDGDGKYMTWDESQNKLIVNAANINKPAVEINGDVSGPQRRALDVKGGIRVNRDGSAFINTGYSLSIQNLNSAVSYLQILASVTNDEGSFFGQEDTGSKEGFPCFTVYSTEGPYIVLASDENDSGHYWISQTVGKNSTIFGSDRYSHNYNYELKFDSLNNDGRITYFGDDNKFVFWNDTEMKSDMVIDGVTNAAGGFVLPTSIPASPVAGSVWLNTTTNLMGTFDGSNWYYR